MAKQYKNTGQIAGAWEVQVQKPLDDRSVAKTFDDLLNPETWKGEDGNYYHYKGMIVSCADTGSIYTYRGDTGDTTVVRDPNNWIKSSSGSTAGTQVDMVVVTNEPTTTAELETAWRNNKGNNAVVGNMIVFYSNQSWVSKFYVKVTSTVWASYVGSIISAEAAPVATIASVNVLSYK